ncbi:MAG: hypothetical protein P4L53_23115 [Candidatus Obscuribacterales bacterium]|nr:hypothetical protein [Candidatus Obscuribacterales bacterium]
MVQNNAVIISHQLRFLKDRVDLTRVYLDGIAKTNSVSPDAPLFKVDEPIKLFARAIQDCIDYFGKVSVDSFLLCQKTHLGYFQKRLRRARIAHEQLEKLSKQLMSGCWTRRVDLLGEKGSEHSFIRRMEQRSRLQHMQVESMNDLLNMQVSAILSCQACVYAATVVAVSTEVQEVQDKAIAVERAASPV